MGEEAALLPGTLDLLILKAVSLAPEHGYGVLLRIEQITGGALLVEQGALYPALARLETQGLLESEWGTSDNNRRAKFYRLTATGRRVSKLTASAGAASRWRCRARCAQTRCDHGVGSITVTRRRRVPAAAG
jgi:transcriptional regulator